MKILLLSFIAIVLVSCAPKMTSVIDVANKNKPFKNVLIILPVEKKSLQSYSNGLKTKLESNFSLENKKAEIVFYQMKSEFSSPEAKQEIRRNFDSTITEKSKDLLIIFQALDVNVIEYPGDREGLSRKEKNLRTFKIVATDVKSRTDVWVGSVDATGFSSGAEYGKKMADLVYSQLKKDGIL